MSSVVVSFPCTEHEELKKWNKVDVRRTKRNINKKSREQSKYKLESCTYRMEVQYLHCLKLTAMSADKS